MADEHTDVDELTGAASGNDRSTIAFPYQDLDTAAEVARACFARSGKGLCDLDELAAQMNHTMSGGFRAKTGTARVFGLIEKEGRNAIRLTPIGLKLVSPEEERSAKIEAFLNVPLYAKVFDAYRGSMLPPTKGLEREMQALGVAPKQTDRARLAFERSARQAGFFEAGEGRLVKPRIETSERRLDEPKQSDAAPAPVETRDRGNNAPSESNSPELHPFVIGLLKTLPKTPTEGAQADWAMRERVKWLRTAASIFGLIYGDEDGGEIEITIKSDR